MTLVGQPPLSESLEQALELWAKGDIAEAEATAKRAALAAKGQYGSGSPPLARAYADMGRLHYRMGQYDRAGLEFQHAAKGPLPPENQQRQDRLSFLLGFGACLGICDNLPEAEKVLRQALAFARNLNGAQSASAFVSLVPLADVLLKAGRTQEAAKLANEAYDGLWKLGDHLFCSTVGTRAEVFKATNNRDDPFVDLGDLPDDMVATTVTTTLTRAGLGDPYHVRAVLADLLAFVETRFGDQHALTADTIAAIAHHEAAVGHEADMKIRRTAVRRAVWSYVVRRLPGGLLSNLDVDFDDETVHLAPHLTREARPEELAKIEQTLTEALKDLYSRPVVIM